MMHMRTWVVLAIATAGLLLSGQRVAARQRPSFSGTWTFLEAQATTRDGREVPAHILLVSGAGFNCGAQCTIVQDARTIRVSRPAENGTTPRDLVLTFAADDPQSAQPQTNAAHATWDGDTLLVTQSMGPVTIRQTIVRQQNRLIVTSRSIVGTDQGEEWRQTYIRP
jgi:hypothetical protein